MFEEQQEEGGVGRKGKGRHNGWRKALWPVLWRRESARESTGSGEKQRALQSIQGLWKGGSFRAVMARRHGQGKNGDCEHTTLSESDHRAQGSLAGEGRLCGEVSLVNRGEGEGLGHTGAQWPSVNSAVHEGSGEDCCTRFERRERRCQSEGRDGDGAGQAKASLRKSCALCAHT